MNGFLSIFPGLEFPALRGSAYGADRADKRSASRAGRDDAEAAAGREMRAMIMGDRFACCQSEYGMQAMAALYSRYF